MARLSTISVMLMTLILAGKSRCGNLEMRPQCPRQIKDWQRLRPQGGRQLGRHLQADPRRPGGTVAGRADHPALSEKKSRGATMNLVLETEE